MLMTRPLFGQGHALTIIRNYLSPNNLRRNTSSPLLMFIMSVSPRSHLPPKLPFSNWM
jgi:hypothetical protein